MKVQRTINGAGVKPAKGRGAEGGRRRRGQVGCGERDRAVCAEVGFLPQGGWWFAERRGAIKNPKDCDEQPVLFAVAFLS